MDKKRSKVRSLLTIFLVLGMLVWQFPMMAANDMSWSSLSITGNVLDLSTVIGGASGKKITIPVTVKELTIKGEMGATYNDLIITSQNRLSTPLTLTIQDVKITNGCIDIASQAGTTLLLKGKNSVQNNNGAAVRVNKNGEILIIDTVTDKVGELSATGGNGGAGIGSDGNGDHGGDIIIQGGKIIALGNGNGAGIGGGGQRSINSISIQGTTEIISSIGGSSGGAGIGGSEGADMKTIIIKDDCKIYLAKGTAGGAGVGGGEGKKVDSISIGGNAYIKEVEGGLSGGAGIGGSLNGETGTINITENCKIELAQGVSGGAGIGGGSGRGINLINISGGTIVKASGTKNGNEIGIGAGIGSGKDGNGKMSISGGLIEEAIGGSGAAGIGGADKGKMDITMTGGRVNLTQGGDGASGFGNGRIGESPIIIITGEAIIDKAFGGSNGAGIGGGEQRSANITISADATIGHAKGGSNGAGIGGGAGDSSNTTITINGGTMYAESGDGNINDIGIGGKDGVGGKTEGDLGNANVNIDGGDVFINHNNVDYNGPDHLGTGIINYTIVSYKNYDVDITKAIIYTGKTVNIKKGRNSETIMDTSFVTDSNGQTTFGYLQSSDIMGQYWLQIDEKDGMGNLIKVYFGKVANTNTDEWRVFRKKDGNLTYIGFKGDFVEAGAEAATGKDSLESLQGKCNGTERIVVEIPVDYEEATPIVAPGVTIIADKKAAEIRPFSLSQVEYGFNTEEIFTSDINIKSIKSLDVYVDLHHEVSGAEEYRIEFDYTDVKGRVYMYDSDSGEYVYNSSLDSCIIVDSGYTSTNHEIKLSYSGVLLNRDKKHKVRIVLSTPKLPNGASTIKKYKEDYVDHSLEKTIQVKITGVIMREDFGQRTGTDGTPILVSLGIHEYPLTETKITPKISFVEITSIY